MTRISIVSREITTNELFPKLYGRIYDPLKQTCLGRIALLIFCRESRLSWKLFFFQATHPQAAVVAEVAPAAQNSGQARLDLRGGGSLHHRWRGDVHGFARRLKCFESSVKSSPGTRWKKKRNPKEIPQRYHHRCLRNKERGREEPIIVVISAVTSLFHFKIGTKQYTVRYKKYIWKCYPNLQNSSQTQWGTVSLLNLYD